MELKNEHDLVKIELGCGKTKSEGYIGVDRYPMPGVDIVADMNKKLPFQDEYADIVYASHSLEHLDDMQHIISEIFRISKDRAIIYILAPYASTSLNIANFYHKIQFNEDTFRLFSNEKDCIVDKEIYYCPHSYEWGLEQSDNSEGTIELKLLKMEFFYYKEYVNLSEKQKLHARKAFSNVCDQIFYALLVNKNSTIFSNEELQNFILKAKEFEPTVVRSLRNRDLTQAQGDSVISDILHDSYNYTNKSIQILNSEFDNLKNVAYDLTVTTKKVEDKFNENLLKFYNEINNKIVEGNREFYAKVKKSDEVINEINNEINKEINEINNMKQQFAHVKDCLEDVKNSIILLNESNNQHNKQLDSLRVIVLDVLKRYDKNKLYYKLYNYYTNKDFFNILKMLYSSFIDGVVLQNVHFNKNTLLTASNIMPYENYFEYNLYGEGNRIHFFLFANYGANIFIELVKDNVIAKQLNLYIQNEGEQIIECDKIEGEFIVRFKALDNRSIVRLLELTNKNKYIFTNKTLAFYIDE